MRVTCRSGSKTTPSGDWSADEAPATCRVAPQPHQYTTPAFLPQFLRAIYIFTARDARNSHLNLQRK